MITMAGTVLTRDLVSAEGTVVASRGDVVDLSLLRDVAGKAPRGLPQAALHQTGMSDAILCALDEPALLHVCAEGALRGQLADIMSEVRFPEQVWLEPDSM